MLIDDAFARGVKNALSRKLAPEERELDVPCTLTS